MRGDLYYEEGRALGVGNIKENGEIFQKNWKCFFKDW